MLTNPVTRLTFSQLKKNFKPRYIKLIYQGIFCGAMFLCVFSKLLLYQSIFNDTVLRFFVQQLFSMSDIMLCLCLAAQSSNFYLFNYNKRNVNNSEVNHIS